MKLVCFTSSSLDVNADNEDSEEIQKCLLEDNEIIKSSEQGLTINNNEDESELIEIGDTIILEEKVCEIDIKSILQLADSFHESLHVFKQQQKICKEEMNSCLDTCDQVHRRLQQLSSAMIKVKCHTSEQTTIRDCFFHKTK